MKIPVGDRKELAIKLNREVDAAQTDQASLELRWQKNLAIYYGDETATAQNVIEGIKPYPFTAWRPKCDRLVGNIITGMLSAWPIVQCINAASKDGSKEEILQKALTEVANEFRFDRVLPLALHQAANTNLGTMRLRPIPDKDGSITELKLEWFRPQDTVFYPTAYERVEECKTVGHRTYRMLWEIQADQKKGLYYDDVEVRGGDNPTEHNNLIGTLDQTTQVTTTELDDEFVELYELITYAKIEDEMRRVIVTLAKRDEVILRVQPYNYSRPWYEIIRLCRTEKRIYTNDSIAKSVQGTCLGIQDLFNFIIVGAMQTALPVVWTSGYSGPRNLTKYTAGQVFHLNADGKMGVVGMPFDASKFNLCIEKFMDMVDATVGISTLGTSGNLPPQTKATAINAITAADEQRQASFLDAVAEGVEGIWSLMLEFIKHHFDDLKEAYASALADVTPDMLLVRYRLEATGKSGATNPAVLIQKSQMVMEMASNPAFGLDPQKAGMRLLEFLQLPYNTESLLSDEFTQFRQLWEGLKAKGVDPMTLLNIGAQAMKSQMENNGLTPPPDGGLPGPGMGGDQGIPDGGAGQGPGGPSGMPPGPPQGIAG